MTSLYPRTVVIGVGNPLRGDDGVGPAVARILRPQVPTRILVLEESGEGTLLMDAWRGASRLILIDAVCSGCAPGTVHRIDASAAPVPTTLLPSCTHAFGLADAVEMARALQELPPHVVIYGIEASNFDETQCLCAAVQEAADTVSAEILNLLCDK